MTDLELAKKYLNKASDARERRIPFTLSLKRFKQIMNATKCYFTGQAFNPDVEDQRLTVDRVDASKGYSDDNCVACICHFNRRKGGLSVSDMELALRKSKKFLKL